MLKPWHRAEIFEALARRGWSAPEPLPTESYEVGEQYQFLRGGELLLLSFMADLGTGYQDPASIEEAVATHQPSGSVRRLWLNSRSDAKWRQALLQWADFPVSAV